MPDTNALRAALANALDAIPHHRWSAFLRDASALFQRYREQRVDLETFRRAWHELILDAQQRRRTRSRPDRGSRRR